MNAFGTGHILNKDANKFVTVEVFGQPYTFKAEAESKRAQDVADYLVREVKKVEMEVAHRQPGVNKQAILILAALNIANAHFELKRNYSDFLQILSNRTGTLLQSLEAAVR